MEAVTEIAAAAAKGFKASIGLAVFAVFFVPMWIYPILRKTTGSIKALRKTAVPFLCALPVSLVLFALPSSESMLLTFFMGLFMAVTVAYGSGLVLLMLWATFRAFVIEAIGKRQTTKQQDRERARRAELGYRD